MKSEKIWEIQKKGKLKCEMIGKLWMKSKFNSEMIWKIWKKMLFCPYPCTTYPLPKYFIVIPYGKIYIRPCKAK